MKRKSIGLILSILLVTSLAMFGCGESEVLCSNGIHIYDNWVITTEATCTIDGVRTHTCSVCNKTETEVVAASHIIISLTDSKSDICKVCDTVFIDKTELETFKYEEDKNYSIKFFDNTSISVLKTLLEKSVKSFEIDLFKKEYNLIGNLVVKSPLTLNGNGATLLTNSAKIFDVKTSELELINFSVKSSIGANAIDIGINETNVYLDKVKVNFPKDVTSRGITYSGNSENSTLTVKNCEFLIGDTQYNENEAVYNNARGISLWNPKNAKINVSDSKFKGFSYTINLSGDKNEDKIIDATECEVNVNNCELTGWSAFNIWVSGAKINVHSSKLKGINNNSAGNNSFSIITINDDIYNIYEGTHSEAITLVIENCTFENYQNDEALNSVLTEKFIRIDNEGVTKIVINNTTFTDTTGKITSVIFSGKDDIDLESYLNDKVTCSDVKAISHLKDGTTRDLPMILKVK